MQQRHPLLPAALLAMTGGLVSGASAADSAPDMAATATLLGGACFTAFGTGDPRAVAAFWASDGDCVTPSGGAIEGREARRAQRPA